MFRHTVYLNNAQLARLNPIFSTIRPGYLQRVEVIFTKGKADPVWKGSQEISKGVARDITVRENPKFLNAIVGIDLNRNIPAPRMSFSIRKPNQLISEKAGIKEIREEVFRSLLHELQHVIQGWVWGEKWGVMSNQANAKGYTNNRYERASEDVGTEWVNKHRSQLSSGIFDDLIPIQIIQEMAK